MRQRCLRTEIARIDHRHTSILLQSQHTHTQIHHRTQDQYQDLGDESRRGSRVVLEGRGDLLLGLIVASETVDPGLDEDKTELGVLVLPVYLEMLPHRDRLFDEVPKALRDGWSKSYPQTKGVCITQHGKWE